LCTMVSTLLELQADKAATIKRKNIFFILSDYTWSI
jgi:hypothetical protein